MKRVSVMRRRQRLSWEVHRAQGTSMLQQLMTHHGQSGWGSTWPQSRHTSWMKMGPEERRETWLDGMKRQKELRAGWVENTREEGVSYTALQDSRLFILQASQGKGLISALSFYSLYRNLNYEIIVIWKKRKENTNKNVGKEMIQAVNKHVHYTTECYFSIFFMFGIYVSLLNFIISCDLFCHSKKISPLCA